MLDLINNYDSVSFDIFDTLLIRDFLYPIDLFKYIEEQYQLKDFQKRRIAAEFECRNNSKEEEITFRDIYRLLDNIDPKIELSVEYLSSQANPEIKALYERAVRAGKKIIAISDMYLDEKFIRTLLVKCGYKDINKVYISSSHRIRKDSGNLYRYVLEDLVLSPDQLIHIGDNHLSDYIAAKEVGIHAYHHQAQQERLKRNKNHAVFQSLIEHNTPQASLYSGLIAKQMLQGQSQTYWHKFGFEYAGIAVYQFIEWLYLYSIKHNIKRLYFLSRDGEIMKKVFDELYKDEPIQSFYLYGSRRTFFMASIENLDDKTLDYLTQGAPDTTIKDFIERLEFPSLEIEAKKDFGELDKKIIHSRDRYRLRDFFKRHEKIIVSEAQQERKYFISYLSKLDFFLDEDRALVDIGWNVTSQKYLEKIIGKKIRGAYFGVKETSYWHEQIDGFYFHRGIPRKNLKLVAPILDIVELFFLGTHASVMSINKDMKPTFYFSAPEEHERIRIAPEIQSGVIHFTNTYSELLKKYRLTHDQELLDMVIRNVLEKPSLEDINHIGKLSYATGFGDSSYNKILQNVDLTFNDFLINIMSRNSDKNANHWRHGWIEYQYIANKKSIPFFDKLIWLNGKIRRCRFHGLQTCVKKVSYKIKHMIRINFISESKS